MRTISLFLLCCFSLSAQVLNENIAFHELVYQIRDPDTGPEDFRKSLQKIGEYLALEALQDLTVKEREVKTLTGAVAKHRLLGEKPVLVTILRAGLPLLLGVQEVFPDSEVGFLAMARDEETLKSSVDYIGIPEVAGKTVILVDTMLATGGSASDGIEILRQYGAKKIVVICAIASQAGLAKVFERYPELEVYPAAVDPFLNDKGYIVPGLGDAGDRSYGRKR